MKVILTQNVPNVGEAGAIKEVADGYARNYLIPKKLAQPATRGSIKQAEVQAELMARRANKERETVQTAAAGIEGKVVRLRARVGSENRLYGSVTSADVAEAVAQQLNAIIDRRRIQLGEAIHRTGTYPATADFGNGIVANFQVEVLPEAAGASGESVAGDGQAAAAQSASSVAGASGEAGEGTATAAAGEQEVGAPPVRPKVAQAQVQPPPKPPTSKKPKPIRAEDNS